jgi:hypothetical protein
VVVGCVVGIAPECLACTCEERTDAERFAEADVVFTGIVTDIERTGIEVAAMFDVKTVEKGGASPEQEIFTPGDSAACGASFKDGERYQVFANRDADGHLTTTLCSTPGTLAAGKRPYVSTEGTPPPSPTQTPPLTRDELIERGSTSEAIREQLQQQRDEEARRRNYMLAVVGGVVIVLATAVLLRRRRRARAPGGTSDA